MVNAVERTEALEALRATGLVDREGRLLGVSVDLTERVQAKEHEREQAAGIAAAVEAAEVGFSEWRVRDGLAYLDERLQPSRPSHRQEIRRSAHLRSMSAITHLGGTRRGSSCDGLRQFSRFTGGGAHVPSATSFFGA